MAPRTRKQHEEGEQETVSFAEIIHNSPAVDDLVDDFRGVHRHLDRVSAQVESLRAEVTSSELGEKIDGQMNALVQFLADREQRHEQALASVLSRLFPEQLQEDNREHAKVMRRRSLDDMQFALKRLMQPEPRPADDDSPQVLQDAINETIALRQLVMDLMQASMNMHQHGLTTIRDMTAR